MGWTLAIGLLVPLLGTLIGASIPFLLGRDPGPRLTKSLLGFASGVMIAASVFSLIIPAMELGEAAGVAGWIPASIGFLVGIAFLLAMDAYLPHWHLGADSPEGGDGRRIGRPMMLLISMALHNLPEGMAVGVLFAGALSGDATISMAGAIALAVGIAVQNIPETAVVSAPLTAAGMAPKRAFLMAFLSGVIEPIGAIAAILLAGSVVSFLPYLLAFAAGAMIYVVIEELIPETQVGEHSNVGVVGAALGFVLMMILGTVLG